MVLDTDTEDSTMASKKPDRYIPNCFSHSSCFVPVQINDKLDICIFYKFTITQNVNEIETLFLNDKFWGLITTFLDYCNEKYISLTKIRDSICPSWECNSHSLSQLSRIQFLIPVLIPKSWESNFNSYSRFQNLRMD